MAESNSCAVQGRVTFGLVEHSLKNIRKGVLRTEAEREQFADYVQRAVRRKDWNDEVRRNEIPAYEIALATVMALQALLRCSDGRLPSDGSLRATGLEPKPAERAPVIPTAMPAQRLAYIEPAPNMPKGPMLLQDPDEREYAGEADQRGFQLGNIVDPNDELSWYWGESAIATGMSSTFDAMITKIASGGAIFVHQDPVGPDEHMFAAASRQAAVMQAMRGVPARLQAVLEVAYSDRRCVQQDVTTYGRGVAAIVARASQDAGSAGAALKALEAWTVREEDVAQLPGVAFKPRLKRAAGRLLETAQRAYATARYGEQGAPSKPRRRPSTDRTEVAPSRQLSARRTIIEVVRVA